MRHPGPTEQKQKKAFNPAATRRLLKAIASDRAVHWPTVLDAIDAGADPNARDHEGWSVLDRAADENSPGLIARLVARGADVNHPDPEGCTALMTAAIGGFPATLRAMFRAGADASRRDDCGRTALHYLFDGTYQPFAAESVVLLIEKGADPRRINGLKESTWADSADLAVAEDSETTEMLDRLDVLLAQPRHAAARRALWSAASEAQQRRLLPRCSAIEKAESASQAWGRPAGPVDPLEKSDIPRKPTPRPH